MFNSTKSNDVKDKAEDFKDVATAAVSDAASDAKDTVQELGRRISSRTKETKGDAEALIESLRELLGDTPVSSKTEEIKATNGKTLFRKKWPLPCKTARLVHARC